MITKKIANNHLENLSVGIGLLESDFLNGADWDITGGNNDATITGVVDPSNALDVANKRYVDGLVDGSLKQPEAYDPTVTGNYPTTYGGNAIEAGDSYRITAPQAGIGDGARDVNTEDLLIALVDTPSATVSTDWMVAESNRDQATETQMGVAEIATQAEVDAGVDDLRFVTPAKLTALVGKTTRYANELHTTTVVASGNTLYTLANVGTHATEAVKNVCLYFDSDRMTVGVDYTVAGATGVITVLFDVTAGRQLVCDYESQDA